jgi:RecB family exonuclease
LHAALQRFHDSSDVGVQTTEEALQSMEENWMMSGYASPEEAEEAYAEGRTILRGFIGSKHDIEPGSQVLFVEKDLHKDMGEWMLAGRVDRIDQRSDGSIEIIDYKTGDTSPENPLYDIALGCYALLARELYIDKQIRTTLISLKSGEKVSVLRDKYELEAFESDLRKLAIEILYRDYPTIDPKPKRLCCNCDFLTVCSTGPDFAEDFSQYGEVPSQF